MSIAIDQALFERSHHPGLLSLERNLSYRPGSLKDFSVPVNAYFPPQELMESLQSDLPRILRYYPSRQEELLSELSDFVNLPADQLVLSNGSTELITWIDRLFIKESLMTEVPTFGRWTDQSVESGKRLETFLLKEEENFELNVENLIAEVNRLHVRALVLCSPNNPTGKALNKNKLLKIFEGLKKLDLIIIDESFLEFSALKKDSGAHLVEQYPNLLILRSLGKNFGLHGLRMGYAITHPDRAQELRRALPPWNINAVAEHFLRKAFQYVELYEESKKLSISDAHYLEQELKKIDGIKVFEGQSNFRYVKVLEPVCGQRFRDSLLLDHQILVRECASKVGSTKQFLRIASRPKREVNALVRALKECLEVGGASLNSVIDAQDY